MKKKAEKKSEESLAKLRLRRNLLGTQILRLEDEQWGIAWKIAQRECPVKVGQVIRKPAFSRRYVVTAIDSASSGAKWQVVTWSLRVAVINKDGTRRRRSRPERVYSNEFMDNFVVEPV